MECSPTALKKNDATSPLLHAPAHPERLERGCTLEAVAVNSWIESVEVQRASLKEALDEAGTRVTGLHLHLAETGDQGRRRALLHANLQGTPPTQNSKGHKCTGLSFKLQSMIDCMLPCGTVQHSTEHYRTAQSSKAQLVY